MVDPTCNNSCLLIQNCIQSVPVMYPCVPVGIITQWVSARPRADPGQNGSQRPGSPWHRADDPMPTPDKYGLLTPGSPRANMDR